MVESYAILLGLPIKVKDIPPLMDKSADDPFADMGMFVDDEPPPPLPPGPPSFFPSYYVDDHLRAFLTKHPILHVNHKDKGQWHMKGMGCKWNITEHVLQWVDLEYDHFKNWLDFLHGQGMVWLCLRCVHRLPCNAYD